MCAVCWLPFSCSLMVQVSSDGWWLVCFLCTYLWSSSQATSQHYIREEDIPWREKSHGDCASVTAERQSIAHHLLNTHVQNCQCYIDSILKDLFVEIHYNFYQLSSVLNIVWRPAYIWKYMPEVYTQLMKIQEQIYRLLGNRKCLGRSRVQYLV